MKWNSIRLELARTPDFPSGSVSRAFLLRLPIDEKGMVDWGEVSKQPSRATIRRFWASEPDRRGRIRAGPDGGILKDSPGGTAPMFDMAPQPLKLGEKVMVTAADGSELPFKVAFIKQLE
ncbi:hypothetical protein G7077_06930 [Sphingomonas piscis]|uniref:Uncharacterized protein n=1 Tax=Sphingomonas piscis TaxID=2714943 RepID=A0A6G7YPK9_9SPHN|nr:hypothetical protein [Sphingomonas piscis]QIK78671.1 hypothetical protein G7077_06930 [Sphingomonas piscis]